MLPLPLLLRSIRALAWAAAKPPNQRQQHHHCFLLVWVFSLAVSSRRVEIKDGGVSTTTTTTTTKCESDKKCGDNVSFLVLWWTSVFSKDNFSFSTILQANYIKLRACRRLLQITSKPKHWVFYKHERSCGMEFCVR